ncbi:MAG: phosphatidate cytidylyltransferase [Negativicutes bacterium]|nr:phosphatidate cytidylyltransferase [Negativicutes bacterium]
MKRVLTTLAGIPLAIYIINTGGLIYAATITLLALLAWYEYTRMMAHKAIRVSFVLGLISILTLLACAWWGNPNEIILVITVSILIALILPVFRGAAFSLNNASYTVTGIVYIGLPFAHLLLLRLTDASLPLTSSFGGSLSAGAVYLWLAFTGTWASDTFAFLVGSKLGKHKLCPAVSPGKTVEGAAGGLLGSVLVVTSFGSIYGISLTHLIVLGALVGIAAPLGDLTESALKRYAGVKDSGRLLPGHGGVLDRFDSIMFTAITVYYYVRAYILH